jgi:hypothetical protein
MNIDTNNGDLQIRIEHNTVQENSDYVSPARKRRPQTAVHNPTRLGLKSNLSNRDTNPLGSSVVGKSALNRQLTTKASTKLTSCYSNAST